MEQVSGKHQAKASASRGPITLQMVTSISSIQSTEGALWEEELALTNRPADGNLWLAGPDHPVGSGMGK